MRDDAAREFERRVGGIVRVGDVGLARPRQRAWEYGSRPGKTTLYLAEQIVEHVAPVAQHVENDAAAVLLAIVPRRSVGGLPVAFKNPVAELAAHGEQSAEEPRLDQHAQLEQAGQE